MGDLRLHVSPLLIFPRQPKQLSAGLNYDVHSFLKRGILQRELFLLTSALYWYFYCLLRMIIPRVDLHGDTGAPIARFLGLIGMAMSILCFLSPLPTINRVEHAHIVLRSVLMHSSLWINNTDTLGTKGPNFPFFFSYSLIFGLPTNL
jgi:hypothetical protein